MTEEAKMRILEELRAKLNAKVDRSYCSYSPSQCWDGKTVVYYDSVGFGCTYEVPTDDMDEAVRMITGKDSNQFRKDCRTYDFE